MALISQVPPESILQGAEASTGFFSRIFLIEVGMVNLYSSASGLRDPGKNVVPFLNRFKNQTVFRPEGQGFCPWKVISG